MAKAKKVRTLFDGDNYKAALRLVRASGLPYKVVRTNYTLDIQSDILNVYFMTNMLSKHPFILYPMIKRDILASGIEKPVILKKELKYFQFNELKILEKARGQEVFNIDIKSAYANALNNYGLLTEKTFRYLSNVDKSDRLAAMGMLASSYDTFEYDGINPHPISDSNFTKDTEVWFLLAVYEIQKLMMDIMYMIGADFLFFWVDGVFFTGRENREKIENYLREKNFRNSFEQCYGFRYWKEKNTKYLSYWKPSGDRYELKQLNLPAMDKEAKDFVIKFCKLLNDDTAG